MIAPRKNDFPLPPAPDGKPPVRLPFGGQPQAAQGDAMGDPNQDQELARLLEMLGGMPDQM